MPLGPAPHIPFQKQLLLLQALWLLAAPPFPEHSRDCLLGSCCSAPGMPPVGLITLLHVQPLHSLVSLRGVHIATHSKRQTSRQTSSLRGRKSHLSPDIYGKRVENPDLLCLAPSPDPFPGSRIPVPIPTFGDTVKVTPNALLSVLPQAP